MFLDGTHVSVKHISKYIVMIAEIERSMLMVWVTQGECTKSN